MSWVRIDDHAHEHRKQTAAGPAACWLWVCGLMYCNRQGKRDGVIPASALHTLGVDGAKRLAAKLVEVGLWEQTDTGFLVHDYHDYQPTDEQMEERRAKRREAGRLGGQRSGEARREANAKQVASKVLGENEAKANPDPDPDPDPRSDQPETHSQDPTPVSPAEPEEPGVFGPAVSVVQLTYQRAYERGIGKVTGRPFAMPAPQRPELHQAMVSHARSASTGKALRGDVLLGWLEAAAEDFARFVVAEVAKEPKALDWYSGLGPKGFLKFLNRDALLAEARRVG